MIRNFVTKNEIIELWLDTFEWVFPLSFRYQTFGNRKRPWAFSISFLCFEMIIKIAPESRPTAQ